VLAAAIAGVGIRAWVPRTTESPTIRIEVSRTSDRALRGADARPGDTIRLEARTGGAAFAELRLYLNDFDLVLRCSEEAPCERRGGRLEATFAIRSVGRYQGLLLASTAPIPPPSGEGLDADAGRARSAGASVGLPEEVLVR
jgi:hypothetical protein